MIVATRPDPTVRPPSRYQTGVLLCANGDFRVICVGKSGFSIVSVWFFGILLSWCYHTIYYQKNNALHYQILLIVMYHFQFQFSLCFSSTNNTSD